MPAGTTLDTSTGTVSGTPTTSGVFSYTIQVTDHDGATAAAASSGTIASVLDLTATPSVYTEVGITYSQMNVASGGTTPYTYSVVSGTLPAGTTLDISTGTVSGTPTTSGVFSYTIQVTDHDGATATAASNGTIASVLNLTATPSVYTEVGIAYSQTNVASGGTTPYTYSVVSGTLPAGTTLDTSTGTVSGTPTTAGAFSYTIQVTDNDGATAIAASSGTIAAVLDLTATPSVYTEVGIAYSQTNVASGGTTPYTYSVVSGTLPAGTTLDTSTGTVSGTPTTSGVFSYTIQVTDNDGATATAASSGTIAAVLDLTATPSVYTEVGVAYSQANVASGGTSPYSYSLISGTLPAGTTLDTSTGTVSGTPTTSGVFSYTIQVTDNDGATATAASSGTIAAVLSLTATPSVYTEVGVAYSQTNVASGGTSPYSYSLISGTLPAGTTLDTSTGTVSGTPTTAGAFSYTIQVTDNDGATATAASSGTIAAVLDLTATPSVYTEVGVAYSQTNVVSGGTTPYTYSLISGTLPAGTTLNTSTGTVSGIPTTAGAFSYTIQVTDNAGATATASSSGTIASILDLTATPSVDTEVGVPYSQTNVGSGGTTPYSYSLISGTLPAGTTLNTSTGTVSGTPTTIEAFSYTIQVTDGDNATATAVSSGNITATPVFTITPTGDGNESISPNTAQSVTYGTTQPFIVTANSGYTLNSAVGGTCPAGSWSGSTYTTGVITADCSVSFSAIQNTTMSLSGSPLLLAPNVVTPNTGSLTITNTGTATAFEIIATLPPDLAVDVTQDASNCTVLVAGASCYLHFTSNNQLYPSTAITISGTNTNTLGATLALSLPYITDGSVFALALDAVNNIIYLGGSFTTVGPNTGTGAPIDSSSGLPVTTFPRVDGTINAVAADGNGGWYIGGAFTTVGGISRNRLAHILSDGTVDPNWNPNANGTVSALALSGSTVYAGGSFATIGGATRNRVAALDATTGAVTSWNPNSGGTVSALAVSGSTVYAGGNFTTIGGATRNRIAALDATTGTATSWNPNANQIVSALFVSGSTVYAGGTFTNIGGATRNRIAALDATTGTATSWNPNANQTVTALFVSGSTVYAGGTFTTSIGGASRNRIAALDATTGTATSWNPNANNTVSALFVSGNTVYAGGSFTTIGGATRNRIAALDATTGTATSWDPNANSTVNALAVSGSTVYAGGAFVILGGQTRNNIAALDVTTGVVTSWNPNASALVYALAVNNSIVYAGGNFTTIGGATRNRIAALDVTTGVATSWNPNASNTVYTLAVSDSTVYAGGQFTSIGGATRNNIAALDATTGTATSWDPNANSLVQVITLSGSTVYAGGQFTTIGGAARNFIAALDVTGAATSWNPNAVGNYVLSLAVSNSTVYAGGLFSSIGGTARNNIAALDATTGAATSWDPNSNGVITALAVSGSTVYAVGGFTTIGGATRMRLAALDANTGLATNWSSNVSIISGLQALALSASTVYVGGGFSDVNNQAFFNFVIIPMYLTP